MCVPCHHREILSDDPILSVPSVVPKLTTPRVFTSELVHGEPVDKCSGLPQEERNKASRKEDGLGACTGLQSEVAWFWIYWRELYTVFILYLTLPASYSL